MAVCVLRWVSWTLPLGHVPDALAGACIRLSSARRNCRSAPSGAPREIGARRRRQHGGSGLGPGARAPCWSVGLRATATSESVCIGQASAAGAASMPRTVVTAEDTSMPCVVVDNGSGFIKSGFAGEEVPRAILPARGLAGLGDAQPLSRGIVQDWDAMEAYWDHAFTHQLGIDTEQCNLFVTSPLFDTKDNKEKLMQTLFETFAAPGVYTAAPAVLELYAAGHENGVVLGSGAECTYAVLVHEGLPDPRTLMRSNIAGDACACCASSRSHPHAAGSRARYWTL